MISGYTKDTPYQDEIEQLREGLERFGLRYKFYGYDCTGDWTKNTMYKAKIVKTALEEYPDTDICWLDADAIIKRSPSVLLGLHEQDFDICCHFREKPNSNTINLQTGTIVFRNNEIVRSIVEDWANSSRVDWDHRLFQSLFENEYANKIRVYPLPESYIKINPKGHDIDDLECVIGHKQLSRSQRKALQRSSKH